MSLHFSNPTTRNAYECFMMANSYGKPLKAFPLNRSGGIIRSSTAEDFLLLETEVGTILTRVITVNLLMFCLPSESMAPEGSNSIHKTIVTTPFTADVTSHMFVEFPTECRRVLTIAKGLKINTSFLEIWKRNVIGLEKESQIPW